METVLGLGLLVMLSVFFVAVLNRLEMISNLLFFLVSEGLSEKEALELRDKLFGKNG